MLNCVTSLVNAHMLDWAARMLAAAILVAALTGEALRYLNAESPAGVRTPDQQSSRGILLAATSIKPVHSHATSL